MKRRGLFLVSLVVALAAVYAGTASGQSGKSARIAMDEFEFRLPGDGKLPKGRVQLTYVNAGEFPHNFTIVSTSEGATRGRVVTSDTIDGGKRQRKTIRLKPGAYVAVCTVGNGGHIAQGMVTRFTVGTFSSENFTWR